MSREVWDMIICICRNCGAEADIQEFVDGFEVGYYDVDNGIRWGSIFLKLSCECGAYGESQIEQ
jgi:hypothetical protein